MLLSYRDMLQCHNPELNDERDLEDWKWKRKERVANFIHMFLMACHAH